MAKPPTPLEVGFSQYLPPTFDNTMRTPTTGYPTLTQKFRQFINKATAGSAGVQPLEFSPNLIDPVTPADLTKEGWGSARQSKLYQYGKPGVSWYNKFPGHTFPWEHLGNLGKASATRFGQLPYMQAVVKPVTKAALRVSNPVGLGLTAYEMLGKEAGQDKLFGANPNASGWQQSMIDPTFPGLPKGMQGGLEQQKTSQVDLGEKIGYRDADEITWHLERATGAVPVSSEDRYKSAQALADVEADEPGIWDAIKSTFISDAGAATAPVDVSDITRPINPSVSRPGGDLPKGFEALVQLIQSDPDFSKKYIGPRDATVTTPLLSNLMSATPVETFEDIPFFQPGAETRWTPPAPAIPDITQALTDFSAIRDADEDRRNREQDERERELEQAADDRREAAQQKTIETARNKTARKKVIAKENKERKAEEKRISDKQAASEKKRRATDKQMADMLKQMNETHQAYLGRKKKEEDRRLRQGYGVGDMWT